MLQKGRSTSQRGRSISPADGSHAIWGRVQVERRVQELLHLSLVDGPISGGRGSRRVPANIANTLGIDGKKGGVEARLNVCPAPHVLRFLLHPHHLRIRVPLRQVLHSIEGERRDLLEGRDGGVVDLVLGAILDQIIVHLAGTEDEALNLVVGEQLVVEAFLDDAAEDGALVELLHAAHALRVPQQALGRNHHQRLAEAPHDLSAEDMVVVGRRREVDHLHVGLLDLHSPLLLHVGDDVGVLVAKLQEPLNACRGVLGALALVSMREEEDQPALPQPLLLSGNDELVDDHLRCVAEVAKLSLPDDEGHGVLDRVSELEAQHSVL
mmetsp:Transcript_9838/g.19622  ORF Transcript_9838/g.19622 Transcript_9838/m.19622 type:complete len:324 (+) Transcript_9838:185-1156(+)